MIDCQHWLPIRFVIGWTVIVAPAATPAALAAKRRPRRFDRLWIGGDPIELGLVASLNRPEGNLTGVTTLNQNMAKRVELLHEVAPGK